VCAEPAGDAPDQAPAAPIDLERAIVYPRRGIAVVAFA
jgi:hypothetical protein